MTLEDLIKVRYKVIADWPGIKLIKVGDILYLHGNDGGFGNGFYYTNSNTTNPQPDVFLPGDVEKYPHLFKRLEWWEERSDDEMAKFVRSKETGRVYPMENKKLKIMNKPIINEVFADNGEHSHWELIDSSNGDILWQEPEDANQTINGEQDELILESLDFYWRHCTEKLQRKDLGDIERMNYGKITAKLYKLITKKQNP